MSSKVVAIVQARMGSTRFPGKMLAKLGKYTLLEWVLMRSNMAKRLDQVILATSSLSLDDPLVGVAEKRGVDVFRGSESDVLGRFVGAARQANADWIVRICADNPFIDPLEIDRLVKFFRDNPCDYACNHLDRLNSRYVDGFGAEILALDLLGKVERLAVELPHREHPTLYLWDHSSEFNLRAVLAPATLAYPNLRFDVDVHNDLSELQGLVDAGVDIETPAASIVRVALKKLKLE